jgi:hypothetical protein
MVLFAVEAGSPQINVRERDGSKVAYGFASSGLPDYDTTSPALPPRQDARSAERGTLKLSSSGDDVRPRLEHAIHSRSRITESLRATPTCRRFPLRF